MMIISPATNLLGLPEMVISALPVQYLDQGIERCGVLAQSLPLIEGEDGHRAAGLLMIWRLTTAPFW